MESVQPLPERNTSQATCEVLVSGAGPVGLLLGCLLKQAGVDVVLIDPHVYPGEGSKAAVTMPRSFEQMELAGVGESLRSLGRPVEAARMCLGGGAWTAELTGFQQPGVASRQVPLTVGQNFVEAALSKRFLELGGRFYRGARVASYMERDGSVEATVIHAPYARPPIVLPPMPASVRAVTQTDIKCKYLVGCDGKRSDVRASMGVSYDGHEYTEKFLLADVEVPLEEIERVGFDKHTMNVILDSPSGSFALFIRLQETRWRTYFCKKDLTPEDLTTDFIQQQWKRLIPPPGSFLPTAFKDLSFFEVACKLAGASRKGRVFLAGDAAHCHSPAGGQGMNTGLQDAANLAWKLASVLKGYAPERLLDSYEMERKPIAEWVLSTSDKMFQNVTSQVSPAFNVVRRIALKIITGLAPEGALPPRFLMDKFFGLSLSYGSAGTCRALGRSPWGSSIRAGDRLPDLRCRDVESTATVFTLELLSQSPNAFLLMLVAETSKDYPSADVIDAALSAFKPTLISRRRDMLVQAIIYFSGKGPRYECCGAGLSGTLVPPKTSAVAGCIPARLFVPADANARNQSPCAEISRVLGLSRDAKAVLVVRPDGYIAVSQLGSWDAGPVMTALEDLGVVSPS